jgi:hypothetical protein
MEDRDVARAFALARAGLGAGLLALPGLVGTLWLGRAARTPVARVALRAVGARDVGLGLGLKAALDRDAPVRGWLEAGMLADGVDMTTTLAGGRGLPLAGRLMVGLLAGSGVALGAWLARSAEPGRAAPELPEPDAARAGASTLTSP